MRDSATAIGYPSLGGASVSPEASHVSPAVESAERAPLAATVVEGLDLDPAHVLAARQAAEVNGTDLEQELVASKHVTAETLASAMAQVLGLPFACIAAEEARIETTADSARRHVLPVIGAGLQPRLYVAPALADLPALDRVLARSASASARIRITTPKDMRHRHAMDTQARRSRDARLSLSASAPDLSARHVLTGAQGAVIAAFVCGLATFAFADPLLCLFVLHVVSAFVFLAPTGLRLAAGLSHRPAKAPLPAPPDGFRPIYSVLVALRQEEEVVPDLVAALRALEWPRSRLEVLLVCEADDPDTIAAARAAIGDEPGFEVVIVPVSHPRTKPKALNFALPLATGEFLVLYDAEDRPHPGQLDAAWRTFAHSDDRLACLQAELTITNGRESRIASVFAVEYAVLFGGFLPWLAKHGLPLPLGGTSNHFRREHLVRVGGWDSHNVTEDADLGIRLRRHGYGIGTLDSETLEDAPVAWRVWHDQRTRWMKGWIQTYLVHMRNPAALRRDLGFKGFATFQILFIGMIVSAIAHPLFLILLGNAIAALTKDEPSDPWQNALMALDLVNVGGGVLAVLLLALATIRGPDRRLLLRRLVWLYPYWILVSISAACAVVDLHRRPHHWSKTPHTRAFTADEDA